MPRILDLELTGTKLVLRLFAAAILGGLAFLVLYYIPANLSAIIKWLGSSLPATFPVNELADFVQQAVSPLLPALGLTIAIFIVLVFIFRKTKLWGPLVFATGLVGLIYGYMLFQGGTMRFTFPNNIIPNTSASISITLNVIMLLFLAAPALTVIKGILLTFEHKAVNKENQISSASKPSTS